MFFIEGVKYSELEFLDPIFALMEDFMGEFLIRDWSFKDWGKGVSKWWEVWLVTWDESQISNLAMSARRISPGSPPLSLAPHSPFSFACGLRVNLFFSPSPFPSIKKQQCFSSWGHTFSCSSALDPANLLLTKRGVGGTTPSQNYPVLSSCFHPIWGGPITPRKAHIWKIR